ncbi:hypothetical protein [Embleya scabrispora]|uniref:hypothetical protein n=1 Tax=Embleya scabrispora TaxID=159449 RepID=UPI0003716687|nr:hypothetical protein [Embleya scabrispora]MYS83921.1 hypothetical protein [Streptomyces sp. SID5474]
MTTSASLDEALGTLATAIEDILDLLAPIRTPAPAAEPAPAHHRSGPDAPEQAVPVLHLDPGIDPDALVQALRHALHR